MSTEEKTLTLPFGRQPLILETGKIAKRAGGSVVARLGETVILVTAVVADEPREGVDFFPLTVDYEERMYAAGKISSSKFIKRENRPSDEAILKARIVDRSVRPLFPKTFRRDVQIIITTLAYDELHDPAAMAVIGASIALLQAGAPFEGPVAAVRMGFINNELVLNPNEKELEDSQLDLIVAGNDAKINMIEAGAKEVSEEVMLRALKTAHEAIRAAVSPQTDFVVAKREKVENLEPQSYRAVETEFASQIKEIVTECDDNRQKTLIKEVIRSAEEKFGEEYPVEEIKHAVENAFHKAVRALILEEGKRPDGRGMDEIRPLSAEVAVLPRVHGSGLFNRGETQALTIATLAGPGQEQWVDTLEEFSKKRYMHHYNFPPYSTGEVKRLGTSRREIGHGALAEKALLPVLPDKEDFPYTIRVVTEITGSNGSTSMAATCGSTLALMDAGVPIKKPVGGIAMGLVCRSDSDYRILTDLQGLEDFAGEMDFKVAGTKDGITAIQLDVKNEGLTENIIAETLARAKAARLKVLDCMTATIASPREELSKYAPRIISTKIDPEKIGELIGPGGKTINKIIDAQGGREILNIDIEDDGTVMITSNDAVKAQAVKAIVESIGRPVEVGQEFSGEVVAIQRDRNSGREIGAIVQLTPNKDGMIHISALGNGQFVERVSDVVKVGDAIKVRVKAVDPEKGRISLERIG